MDPLIARRDGRVQRPNPERLQLQCLLPTAIDITLTFTVITTPALIPLLAVHAGFVGTTGANKERMLTGPCKTWRPHFSKFGLD